MRENKKNDYSNKIDDYIYTYKSLEQRERKRSYKQQWYQDSTESLWI